MFLYNCRVKVQGFADDFDFVEVDLPVLVNVKHTEDA